MITHHHPGPTLEWERVPGHGELHRAVVVTAMRDGVRLVADVYARGGEPTPGPVLLERTPYGRRHARASDGALDGVNPAAPQDVCRRLVDQGFVVVRQDCRGRGDSEGSFVKYLSEAEDGRDTVDWIADQGWCDGRVATMGVSYAAHAQTALASQSPPNLVAMFLDSGGFVSAYDNGVRMGGAFELKQATWALSRARTAAARTDAVSLSALEAEPVHEWFRAMPWRRGRSPLRHVPEYEDYLFDQWEHDDFSDFWRHPGIYTRDARERFPAVPSLHMSSWYDPYVMTAVENFTALRALGEQRVELVLGPWTHGRRSVSYAGDVDFGPAAPLDGNLADDYATMRGQWFADQLAEGDAPAGPVVRYFLMGGGSGHKNDEGRLEHGGSWQTAQSWPPASSRPWLLRPHPDGSLRDVPAPDGVGLTYTHDPADPVPTIGGQVTSGEPVMVGGAFDQRPGPQTFQVRPSPLPLDARRDVVTFETDRLERAVTVVGPVVARLRVSSTAVDTDLVVKLVDVYPASADYPAGYAMNLTEGILRCRYRHGFDEPVMLEPGVQVDVDVVAPDTANTFAAGHRIRVDVASSDFPRFDVNPGTAASPVTERNPVVAHNTLHLASCHVELRVQDPA